MLFRLVALALTGSLILPLPAYAAPAASGEGHQRPASLLDAALAELDRQEASRVTHGRNTLRLVQGQGQASSGQGETSSEDDGHGVWFWTAMGAGVGFGLGLVADASGDCDDSCGIAPVGLAIVGGLMGLLFGAGR